MTEFSHVDVMRFDSDFGSKVTNAVWNSFQASCNEVVTKGGFGPSDFATIHQRAAPPKIVLPSTTTARPAHRRVNR